MTLADARERRQPILVKWGGSLITDKRGDQVLRKGRLNRLCREFAANWVDAAPVILGHGSGSFGHTAARAAGFGSQPVEAHQRLGVAETRRQAGRLNQLVVDRLLANDVPGLSWAASSGIVARAGATARCAHRPIEIALDAGWVPVVFGDVVLDETWGASIHSTETLFLALARALRQAKRPARLAIWCGETDGILDPTGRRIDQIDPTNIRPILAQLSGAAGTDVTGGVRHRVESAWRLAELGVESLILNGAKPGRFARALRGEPVEATRVVCGS